jgi:hypothetical protein
MTAAPAVPATQRSADYFTEISGLLWPPPAAATMVARRSAGHRPGEDQLIVLPGRKRPKLIVPSGRRAGSAALGRYGEPASVSTAMATKAIAAMLTGGLGRFIGDRLTVDSPAGAQTVTGYLSALLGQPVGISMHLGAARANRKPVLQLLTPAGDTIGFAKIGVSPLTTGLVQAERATLGTLAASGQQLMRLPTVLGGGSWNGLEVLVLSPLPVWLKRKPLRPGQLGQALAELAGVSGLTSSVLAASGYWNGLIGRLEQADDSADLTRLSELAARLSAAPSASGLSLTFGGWHGDLTPWNLAHTSGGLLVWDWERYGASVPLGFDALHYWLQSRVARQREDPAQAARQCVQRAPELLKPFGVPAEAARLTALAYLAELSVRYLVDRQEAAGARLGAPGRWLLPALESGIEEA